MNAPHPIHTLTRTLSNPYHRTIFFDEVKRHHLKKKILYVCILIFFRGVSGKGRCAFLRWVCWLAQRRRWLLCIQLRLYLVCSSVVSICVFCYLYVHLMSDLSRWVSTSIPTKPQGNCVQSTTAIEMRMGKSSIMQADSAMEKGCVLEKGSEMENTPYYKIRSYYSTK